MHVLFKEAGEVLGIRGRVTGSGVGGKGAAAVLISILINNGNIGGTGLDGILGPSFGINMAQLSIVRKMGIENQGIA